jgi:hypothetical protein
LILRAALGCQNVLCANNASLDCRIPIVRRSVFGRDCWLQAQGKVLVKAGLGLRVL